MDIKELQQTKTETELPICVGSPLVRKKEKYIVETFNVKIIHTHLNPNIREDEKIEYQPEKEIKVGSVLHIVGTHEQIDKLLLNAF